MPSKSSKSWSLDKKDLQHIVKVFLWTVASALVLALVNLNGSVHYPEAFLLLQPAVNTILVAVYRFVKDNSEK